MAKPAFSFPDQANDTKSLTVSPRGGQVRVGVSRPTGPTGTVSIDTGVLLSVPDARRLAIALLESADKADSAPSAAVAATQN